MIAEDFVARLERVRKSGPRSWSAKCPAHDDKGPSLKVTDADGKILIHCFAGCSPADVVAAVGVELHQLFPPRDKHEAVRYRRERFAKGTLQEMHHELIIALIVLGDVVAKRELSVADRNMARKAKDTIGRLSKEVSGAI